MRLSLTPLSAFVLALITLTTALAQSRDDDDDRSRATRAAPGLPGAAAPDDDEGDETYGNNSLFGFTDDSGVGKAGEIEITSQVEGAFGLRGGLYRFGAFTKQLEYVLVDGFSVEVGASTVRYDIRNVPDLDNRSGFGLGGLSAEFKWEILRRDLFPFGLALIAEPELGSRDEEGGQVRSQGIEARFVVDAELVPGRLFGAFNLFYEAERTRPRSFLLFDDKGEEIEFGDGEEIAFIGREPIECEAEIGVSAALAYQIAPRAFLGAEVRYRRAYEGLALNRFEGASVFVGPTFYAFLTDDVILSGAWSARVADRVVSKPGEFGLDIFSRHEARLQISYEF